MNTVSQGTVAMTDEILSMEEMKSRYPSEFILVLDPEQAEDLTVLGGKVVFHSKSQEEMNAKAVEMKPHRCAFVYTGIIKLGKDEVFAFGGIKEIPLYS